MGAAAWADTILLKNGRKILADEVREKGDRIEYQIGDDVYAIPKSLVDHIDTGGAPLVTHKGLDADLPAPSASSDLPEDSAFGKLIVNGRVDPEVLNSIEKIGDTRLAAAANFTAGKNEHEQGRDEPARNYFERALRFAPDDPSILNWYVNLLVRMRRIPEAQAYAEKAARLAPGDADSWKQLGYVYYFLDRTKDSVTAWTKSLAIRDDATLAALVAKGERELHAESNFSEAETGHFTIHFEGGQTSDVLRQQIIATLESHYDDLVRDFGITPRNIPVSLYTNQAYFDVTHAPSWSAALNDGKLRIPVSGLTSVSGSLSRVLKHELTHSFVAEMTHGRCPQWLNEGVAQVEEGRSSSRNGTGLARLYASQQYLPLTSLESSWTRLSTIQAEIAYAEGLAAVEYVRDTYGMSDVVRILQDIGRGDSTEMALRSVMHSSYQQFDEDLGTWLRKTYGI
jgi:tetratricopeptide (TPR) repeat protein